MITYQLVRMANGITAAPKDRILEALKDLPADVTFADAIERLVFLAVPSPDRLAPDVQEASS